VAIDIISEVEESDALDFNVQTMDGRKLTITLPVLGTSNIPIGMMAVISVSREAMTTGDEVEQARALYGLLESMKGQFPDQYRTLWSMDFQTALKFFNAWFDASFKDGEFDPKA
jgi:hypothetical protein